MVWRALSYIFHLSPVWMSMDLLFYARDRSRSDESDGVLNIILHRAVEELSSNFDHSFSGIPF